jgi:ferritin-like metal-binding protein YciE
MSKEINPAFQEALRELGRPTSPKDLHRRGVTRLRTVKTSDVSRLIERAVNRTLMERTIGPLDPQQMAEIVHAAENQFTRQLRAFEDLADSRQAVEAHRRESQAELARLRETLREREPSEPSLPRASEPSLDLTERLAREIKACLQPLLDQAPSGGLGRSVAEDLQSLVHTHIGEALEAQRRRFQIETENQERRVAKLVESLERTEQVLSRVAASKQLEEGIESIYRTVLGLSVGEQDFGRKQDLMASIFEANLALRKAHESASQFA